MVGRPRRARPALDLDLLWRAYIRRFDIQHTVRFAKQTLGWTTHGRAIPNRPSGGPGWCWLVLAGAGWCWLVLAGYTQLRLARQIACDRRLPWERPRPQPACHPRGSAESFRDFSPRSARQPPHRNPRAAPQADPKAAAAGQPPATQPSRKPAKPPKPPDRQPQPAQPVAGIIGDHSQHAHRVKSQA
jgi:hypothetical protein